MTDHIDLKYNQIIVACRLACSAEITISSMRETNMKFIFDCILTNLEKKEIQFNITVSDKLAIDQFDHIFNKKPLKVKNINYRFEEGN